MNTRKFWTVFFLLATLLTAATIFYFSAQTATASSNISDRITKKVSKSSSMRKKLSSRERRAYMERLSKLIRKNAHFCEYALLGMNLALYLRLRRRGRRALATGAFAWALATLYAVTDELHQLFVPGRSCELIDVGIDSGGALVGVLLAALILVLAARFSRRQTPA